MNSLFSFWKMISEWGIQTSTDKRENRSILITNRIAITLILVSLIILVLNALFVHSVNMQLRLLLMIALSVTAVFLNNKGQVKITKHILSGLPLLVILVLPIYMGDKLAEHDMIWYPYTAIALSILPIIIFRSNENILALAFWTLAYFVMVLFIDKFIAISRNIETTYVVYNPYPLFKLPQVAIFIFLYLSFYYFVGLGRKFEQELEISNDHLTQDAILLKQKTDTILRQNNELVEQKAAIDEINKNLESIVEQRTAELTLRNKQILDYAFHNAHEVRGPLTRLLGLGELVKNKTVDESQYEFVINNMVRTADEMDQIVRKINDELAKKVED